VTETTFGPFYSCKNHEKRAYSVKQNKKISAGADMCLTAVPSVVNPSQFVFCPSIGHDAGCLVKKKKQLSFALSLDI
jgi:hypothetical protein